MEVKREEDGEKKAPLLPKLVMDWTKILGPAFRGYVDQLEDTIERSLDEGTAKLVYDDSSRASSVCPSPIALSAPVVRATWFGQTITVSYLVERFSDIVAEEKESSRFHHFILHCCGGADQTEIAVGRVGHRHGPHVASHVAASLGHEGILRLWGKACVAWRDDLGRTPLHWAAYYGQTKIVEYLIGIGAPVNATNKWGVTPLLDSIDRFRMATGDVDAIIETIKLLTASGANVDEPRWGLYYIEAAVEIFKGLSGEETGRLLLWVANVPGEVTTSIGKLFQLFCRHVGLTSAVSTQNSFSECLLFLSFFCSDVSQVSNLWERALQPKEDATVFLPPIPTYGDRTEVTSWAAAQSIITQAQLSSDMTEVVYQCAVMVERILGSHSPCVVDMLWNAPCFLGLENTHPSQAVERMFLRAVELFNTLLATSREKEYSCWLVSVVSYFDKMMEKKLCPDFLSALRATVGTLELVHKTELGERAPGRTKKQQLENLQECSNFFVVFAFDLLCRAAYLAIRDCGRAWLGELPHEIDDLGVRVMKVCSPLTPYYFIRHRKPSWLKDDEENTFYVESLTQCYQSWVVRAGSLYQLDADGYMSINLVIEDVVDGEWRLTDPSPLLDFLSEHGSHLDAVDSSNQTPYEILSRSRRVKQNLKQSIDSAIGKPPSVFPLACLAARTIIRCSSTYRTAEFLPAHIVRFIEIHDCNRPRNLLISHKIDDFEDAENSTELEAEFRVPL